MKKAEQERKTGLQAMFEPILVVLAVRSKGFCLLVFLTSPREEIHVSDRLSLLLEREPLLSTCTL